MRTALLAAAALLLTACNLNAPAATQPAPTVSAGLALRLELPGARTFSRAGEIVSLEYAVTNTGAAALAGPLLVFDEAAPVSCPPLRETGNRNEVLDPGESVLCTASFTVTQEDVDQGFVTHFAVASAGGARSNPAALTLSYQPEPPAAAPTATPLPATETSTPAPTATPAAAFPTLGLQTTALPTGTRPPVILSLPTFVLPGATLPETATAAPSPTPLPSSPTATPTAPPAPTGAPVLPTETGLPPQEQDALAEAALRSLPKAEYTYLAPERMELEQTILVELRMSVSQTGGQLSTAIVTARALETSAAAPGTLVADGGAPVRLGGGQVEITPRMLVELHSESPGAFEIIALHRNEDQIVDAASEGRWVWQVTAKQAGERNLILVISQQARVDDDGRWYLREIKSSRITVQVQGGAPAVGPANGRSGEQPAWGMGWVVGAAVVLAPLGLVAILAGWYLASRRTKVRRKRPGARPAFGPDSPLSRLPTLPDLGGAGKKGNGSIFLSYRRSDSADVTGRIYDRLVEAFGEEVVFKDVDSIPLGLDYKDYLERKVRECSVLLAVIGNQWVSVTNAEGKKRLDDPEDFVRIEIEAALAQDLPVVPLLVRGARMPKKEDLPPGLHKLVYRNGIPIRPDPDFHWDMDRLISGLKAYLRS